MARFPSKTGKSERKKAPVAPLLALPGVVGVGKSGRVLQVYLGFDSEEIRRQVAEVIRNTSPGMAFRCIVSGPFRAG